VNYANEQTDRILVPYSFIHMFFLYFQAMFRHDLSEAASNEIVVDDIQPKVMEKMINFIAGKNIEFCDATEAGEMLMAAHKYDIKGLFKFCAKEVSVNS
jgi:hypothetical protein